MTQSQRSTLLDGVSAVENGENNSIIGYLTWYSIGDYLYDREDLRKTLIQNKST